MALGGLQLVDLPEDERKHRGLSGNQLALLAKHVGQYGEHAAAKNAGVLKDDVLVEVAGVSERRTEGEMIGHLLGKYQPGDSVPVTVLRGAERIKVRLPMQ
jgi:hypothetical protein